jgi:hypothetical protein
METLIIITLFAQWIPPPLPSRQEWWMWDFVMTPRCCKWPDDKPDIGAFEWLPPELQNEDGTWNGKTLDYNPITDPKPNRPKPPEFAQ